MIKFLVNRLIPEGDAIRNPKVRSAAGALSGGIGIAANMLLFLGKLLAALLSGSVSMAADAMNNLSDASGSVLTLIGFRLAGKPADTHHPYGHARFENLSGLAVAAMIMLIGFELGKTAVEKILHPQPVTLSGMTAGILLASIAVKLWLSLFNRHLGERIQSAALMAAAADSRNDCIATAAVLAAALIEDSLDWRVDGIMGLAVAVFILHSGWKLAGDTISPLLGEGADPQLRQKIAEYVQENPRILGYHDLMVHDYGPGRQYASLHVEMDYREEPLECHEIIDHMEWECLRRYGVHLVIHYDPVVTDDPELTSLKNRVETLLHTRDGRLRFHDFRIVPGRHHRNLVFDLALPEDLWGEGEEIRQEIEAALNRDNPGAYHVRITFDLSDA